MSQEKKFADLEARVKLGGAPKYHQKNAETGKLFARASFVDTTPK